MHILGAIAEFERGRIVERVRAGLARAKAQGNVCDRGDQTADGLVRHTIAGPSTSMRYTARLPEAGIAGRPSAAAVIRTTTPSPNRSSRVEGGNDPPAWSLATSRAVEFAHVWNGWTGSTRGGCWSRLATRRRPNTRHATMSRPQWPDSHNPLSEELGTIQTVRRHYSFGSSM